MKNPTHLQTNNKVTSLHEVTFEEGTRGRSPIMKKPTNHYRFVNYSQTRPSNSFSFKLLLRVRIGGIINEMNNRTFIKERQINNRFIDLLNTTNNCYTLPRLYPT